MTLYQDLVAAESTLDRLATRIDERRISGYEPLVLPDRSRGVPADVLTIGLVGGTGVGKSTIINALAGQNISEASVRRPTTSRIIPYVHRELIPALQDLDFLKGCLSENVAAHEVTPLKKLIILDLPDIDSTRSDHADVVSRALAGLDLVVWVTSLTKYSDREFHTWIERHAAPRSLENAIFMVNKVDTIQERDAVDAAEKLMLNFQSAVLDTLGDAVERNGSPRFFTCAAAVPDQDIPGNMFRAFHDEIARERSAQEIERIKSSDRVALLRTRIDHISASIGFAERKKQLQNEVDSVRDTLMRLIEEPAICDEMSKRLTAGSAAEKAGARLFETNLAAWPILPHLRMLSMPLRQIGRLFVGARLLLPDDDETEASRPFPKLMNAMFRLERERRDKASRSAEPLLEHDREAGHAAMESRLGELENECVLKIRDGLDAMTQPDDSLSSSGRLRRRLLVWAPLIWFPLLQPLLEEILLPAGSAVGLTGRFSYRLVRMFGATHLLVSLAFVLLIYLVYVLVLRARAHLAAVAQCRALLDSEWWQASLLDQLTEYLTGAESEELTRLGQEEAELKTVESKVRELERRLA